MINLPVELTQFKINAFNSGKDKQYKLTFINYDVFPSIEVTLQLDKAPKFKIGQEYEVIIREKE